MRLFSPASRGFSLLELLLATSVFSLLFLAAMSVFQTSRQKSLLLLNEMDIQYAAAATLDKMREDISWAGYGLHRAIEQGVLPGIETKGDTLTASFAEGEQPPLHDLHPGQSWIALNETSSFKKGQRICLLNDRGGEIRTVIRVKRDGIETETGLFGFYEHQTDILIRLKTILFYLDEKAHILRRKVNGSPAQPLCLDVTRFACAYDSESNLVHLHLEISEKSSSKERPYDSIIFPKNTAPHSGIRR